MDPITANLPGSQLALDLLAPRQATLANFVVGRNQEALDALERLLAGELPEPIVYLWGAPGCGRSHLATALAATPTGWRWQAAAAPAAPGVAVVDDIEEVHDERAQVALFNRLNAVRETGWTQADAGHGRIGCLVTGSAAPAQLDLRADLRTRLAWGHVFQLQLLDDAEKAEFLRVHAAARGATVSPELITYMLFNLPRDLRTLAAALDALDRFALARQRPLTVPLLKTWLNQSNP